MKPFKLDRKRPLPEGVALACPAKRGVGRREGPVGAAFVIGAPRGGGVREEIPAGACLGVNDQSNNLTCLSSRSSCSRMHFRTISSSRPSVLTQSSSPTGLSPEDERIALTALRTGRASPGRTARGRGFISY